MKKNSSFGRILFQNLHRHPFLGPGNSGRGEEEESEVEEGKSPYKDMLESREERFSLQIPIII
jgi:hypothetical protein